MFTEPPSQSEARNLGPSGLIRGRRGAISMFATLSGPGYAEALKPFLLAQVLLPTISGLIGGADLSSGECSQGCARRTDAVAVMFHQTCRPACEVVPPSAVLSVTWCSWKIKTYNSSRETVVLDDLIHRRHPTVLHVPL